MPYHKARYPTVEEMAELGHIHPSTLKKYTSLLLTIQDHIKLNPMSTLRNIEINHA